MVIILIDLKLKRSIENSIGPVRIPGGNLVVNGSSCKFIQLENNQKLMEAETQQILVSSFEIKDEVLHCKKFELANLSHLLLSDHPP